MRAVICRRARQTRTPRVANVGEPNSAAVESGRGGPNRPESLRPGSAHEPSGHDHRSNPPPLISRESREPPPPTSFHETSRIVTVAVNAVTTAAKRDVACIHCVRSMGVLMLVLFVATRERLRSGDHRRPLSLIDFLRVSSPLRYMSLA